LLKLLVGRTNRFVIHFCVSRVQLATLDSRDADF
jgi:hypothetical protein